MGLRRGRGRLPTGQNPVQASPCGLLAMTSRAVIPRSLLPGIPATNHGIWRFKDARMSQSRKRSSMRIPRTLCSGLNRKVPWRWLTLPGRYQPSTISADGLNYWVRDGTRCTPVA